MFWWLRRFDERVGCIPGWKVLLFIDNASVHGSATNLPQLHNVSVEFLPPNTTPILQPMDLGVIAAAKKRYKRRVTQRAVDLMDNNYQGNPYKIDLRLAGMWVYKI